MAACTTAAQRLIKAPSAEAPTAIATTPTPTPPLPAAAVVAARLADLPADPPPDEPVKEAPRPSLLAGEPAREFERGGASWYGPGFHGRRTASGERYNMHEFTAAHRTLPFGTWVRVHSLLNGRKVDVRITDRGPFIRSRVIDVSREAAQTLGMLGLGLKEVVLLVPESTPAVSDLPLPPSVVKGRRGKGRVSKAKTP